MLTGLGDVKIYLSIDAQDMRKAINGLSILVQEQLRLDPFGGSLFVFSNRRRDIVKILYWDTNGFCLWQKRLEKERFKWPGCEQEVLEISSRQLQWLLSGLCLKKIRAHKELKYTTLY